MKDGIRDVQGDPNANSIFYILTERNSDLLVMDIKLTAPAEHGCTLK